MKSYRILKPHVVKIGARSLAGAVVTEDKLGDRVAELLKEGAVELVKPKDEKPANGGSRPNA